jgi:putative transcriptional regulator
VLLENCIQQLRKERKITQNELADAVEVTRQTIISLESGRYNASLILAHKIAQYFEMSIEDIFIFNLKEENIC